MNYLQKAYTVLLPLILLMVTGTTVWAQPLNGTYTIYGTGADYSNLAAAANDLNSRGVSGPVVFKIRPGTWTSSSTSQANIINVSGSSATNTITFEAENNSAATTEIRNTNTSSSSNSNYIFRFNNAKYVTVRNLTLNKTFSSNGRCLYYNGAAQYNVVENCVLTGGTSTSTSTNNARVYATSMRDGHHNIIRNNTIEGGGYGIYWRGNSTASSNLSPDNEFTGNAMTPQRYGIRLEYAKRTKVNNNTINSTGSSFFYGIYLRYCDEGMQINNNQGTLSGKTSTTMPIYMFYCDGTSTARNEIKGNEFTVTSSSSTYPVYNQRSTYYDYEDNKITSTSTGTSGRAYAYFDYFGNNVNIKNNEISSRSNRSFAYAYILYYTDNSTFEGNTLTSWGEDASYTYAPYRSSDFEFIGNKITTISLLGNAYGTYAWMSGDQNGVFANNEIHGETISGSSSWRTTYGMYMAYPTNVEIYNNAIFVKSNRRAYGGYLQYPVNTTYYNNSVHTEGTGSTNYAQYINWFGGGYDVDIKNNVFSGTATNTIPLYLRNVTGVTMDYNNFYTPSANSSLIQSGMGSFNTIQAWRNASGMDMNSLSYEPGYINASTGDLRPDPANANSWSLNGRGIQISGNNEDMNGNARAETTIQGVPDLGAYEFVPTSTPPNCAATPAAPAANTDQVFTFGQDTVAVMKWDANVPSNFSMKQYTGTNPPGILSINPTQMFFYVDAGGTGTNLDYEMDLYYKDPWMGTIASESALRLAENVNSGGWNGYSPAVSSSNVDRNFITTPGVMDVGALFTGIDVKDNAGVEAIVEPATPFCPGTYTVKVLVKNKGNNQINSLKIDWELNGVSQGTINHNSTIDINGSTAGNEVIIDLGQVTFGNAPENIKVWTYEPNGNQDPVPGDDTLEVGYRAALQGTYTVGGATPDFPTVVDANDAITQFGTCGDVVFDIRPGTYTGQIRLQEILRAGTTTGRVTFKSENGNRNSVVINHNTTSSDYPVVVFDDADDYTFKDLSIICAGPSYGRAVELQGDSDNDSVINCILQAPSLATTNNAAVYAYRQNSNWSGDGVVLKGNQMSGGFYTLYLYPYDGNIYYSEDIVVDSNTILPTRYAGYLYYFNGLKFTNNKIDGNVNGGNNTGGIYFRNLYENPEIVGNDVEVKDQYAMYFFFVRGQSATSKGLISNNTITLADGGNFGRGGLYVYYPDDMNIFNNSVNVTNQRTSAWAAYFYMRFSSYRNNTIRNNVFVNTGGGYAYYYYPGPGSYNNTSDYNNLYGTGSTLFNYNGTNINTFAAYVATTDEDEHSISYEPGFTSENDLRPDKNNAASWSLNGRAVHISGNDKDKDGNTRVEARADGVPDIGAYEFKPEVIPPLAKAVPATPVAGGTQVFTFGERPVARVTWDASFPLTAPLEVRQYSGEKGMGVASQVAPDGSMYFYTDIAQKGNGTTYKFDAEVDYMDIWLGDIASEGDLRLAHKYNSNFPWMVYSGAMSTANTTTDVLSNNNSVMSLHHFGAYTGLENGSAESAFVVPQGSIVICTGNSVQLNAEPQTGDAYQWYKNGTMISGATGLTYQATQAGDYSVAITYGTKVVEAVPVTVSTIAPSNALVSANGPLTYCVGNGLTLDAGNAQGVSYQWQLNGNNISGATGSTYGVNQSGNYTVVVTNIGCSSTSTVTAVSSGPLTVDLGNDTSYCEVKGVYAQLDAGFPGAKYLWSTGDTTKSIEVRNSGTYWVEVDGGPNCTDRDQIEVTISPLPSANGISYVKNGNTYFFSPSGPINTTGYMWLFSDGSTSTQKNVSKTLNSEDLYVRLVLFNNCGTDTVQLGWKLGVEEAVNAESVSLYPNPAKNQVTVSVTGTALEEVEVVNGLGSVVYRSQVESGKSSHRVDLSNLSNGHYMLRARTTEGMLTRPFDVMK